MTADKIKRIQELQAIQSSAFVNIHSLYNSLWHIGIDAKQMIRIHSEIADLKNRWQMAENELLTLSYCIPLVERAGVELHDAYQEKYPINRLTDFVKAQPHVYEVHYYVMGENNVVWPGSPLPSPTVNAKRCVAKMETWGASDGHFITLAYAPETNTLYWRS